MAYAAVASLSQTIDLVLNFYQNCFDLKLRNQIISLQKHTIFLASFIEESPREANNWEETIREAAELAEDLIELILSDSLLGRTIGSSRSSSGEGRDYQLPYGFLELERAIQQIESIADQIQGRDAEAMDGPDDEVMKIISQLCEGNPWDTVAIFGREGMGKTTLARNVYNHTLIVEHFEIRIWCAVSTDYGLSQVASDLLRSITPACSRRRRDSEDELNLNESLHSYLDGRRVLIVLDDLRSFEDWGRLHRMLLPFDDASGCRILITTRVYRFAKFVSYFHQMRFMNSDRTWNMLREKIFKGDPCPYELESLGKKIAISCRGHPLSVEVVSGILAAADRTVAAWKDILENIKIASEDVGREITELLSLSYSYLPHHLRPCFLYLGIFREDEEIRVSKLLKLWVCEGFLDEIEDKDFEETAEEYVEDLVRRNLVFVSKKKSNGKIKCITINDVMRDMCLRQAHIDNFLLQLRGLDRQADAMKLQWCRRISRFTCDDDFLEGVYGPTIRTTILSLDNSRLGLTRWSIGRNVRLLRILDLSNVYNYDLPEEIFELFHLRYLAIDCMFSISEAISNLENLQTLIICSRESGRKLGRLPEGIWRMPQLRHLLMFCFELPNPTSPLENLQTLSRVEDFKCSIENLNMIPNLKKLALLYTKKLRDVVKDCELHNLTYLQKLEVLKIETNLPFGERHKMSCNFPPTLKKLNLCGVQLPWEDMKIVASLPNLQVLKLRNHACVGERWETSEGGFSQLTFLLIEESNLEHWITKTTHFPKLKCLVLRRCLGLLEVPNDIGDSLEWIELDGQNITLLSSAERIQEDQPSWRYNRLQIRVG